MFWEQYDREGITAEALIKGWQAVWACSRLPHFVEDALPTYKGLVHHWQHCIAQLLVWLSMDQLLAYTNRQADDVVLRAVRLPLEAVEIRPCGTNVPEFVDLLRQPCGAEGVPFIIVDGGSPYHTLLHKPMVVQHGWYWALHGHYRLKHLEDHEPEYWYKEQKGALVLLQGEGQAGQLEPSGAVVYPFTQTWWAAAECIENSRRR